MIPSDQNQAKTEPTDAEAPDTDESVRTQGQTDGDGGESVEDQAWLDACRAELEDDDQYGLSADETDDLSRSHQETDGDENSTSPQGTDTGAVITKTGDDVMSKFGHAIGALAEREEDFDDQALDHAAEMANPSPKRDEAVAPHIAAAERELERTRNSGPTDIFDRIAQAAESQFDESRGSTAKRVNELVDDRRVGTKRWTPSKTMKERMEKLEAARAAAEAGTFAPSSTAAAGVVAAAGTGAAAVAASVSRNRAAEEDRVETENVVDKTQEAVSRQQQSEPEADTTAEAQSSAASADGAEVSTDNLRVIPGARGRRRDRARKSRLDEDFENIFDDFEDEDKPSIKSLRRKLRSTSTAEAAAEAGDQEVTGDAVTDEISSVSADPEPKKKGLFTRLLSSNAKKPAKQVEEVADSDDDLVAAFTDDAPQSDPNLVIDPSVDEENWEADLEVERKQNRLAIPIIGTGAAIALGGIGFFAYKFLAG